MARILIVDDELPMRTALADVLRDEGHSVMTAQNGEVGLRRALDERPDLVLLDVMMPRVDGFSLCAALRRSGADVPVLMLTAKGTVDDRVQGLDSGADDYLVKPFSTRELVARVRALLRRALPERAAPPKLVLGGAEIDFAAGRCRAADGTEVKVTAKELGMLRLLAAEAGKVVTRDRFLDVVWGYASYPTTRTVDNHIAQLRAKFEPHPTDPQYIITVHGSGYRLDLPDLGAVQLYCR